MIYILLDTVTGAQNPTSQTTTIFLIVGLVLGIGMIGFGVYSMLKNKNSNNYIDEDYNKDFYDKKEVKVFDKLDVEEEPEQEEIYVPIEQEIEKRPFEENEISHSIKTNAYKVRDSIRCAHDIDDDVLSKKGYLAILCDGINGDEDTPAYISKRIMDEFYSKDRVGVSIQDFFENIIDKLDAEMVKFSNNAKAGTSMLACVLMGKELYIIGVGSARLYHIRGNSIKQLTSEHRYSLELDAKVKTGEIDLIDAQNNPRRVALFCDSIPTLY